MAHYTITILFDDTPEDQTVRLADTDLAAAEEFTAHLRYDVEEAKIIDAPLVTSAVPGADGGDLTLDPRHVRSIDLAEGD